MIDALSISIPMRNVVASFGLRPMEVERDGLGRFDFFVFRDQTIGYWAFAGSKAYPDVGASVWAEPNVSRQALIAAVKQVLGETECQFINPVSGKIVV